MLVAACGRHPSDACKLAVETARARVAEAKAHFVEPTTPLVASPVDGIGRDATAHVIAVRGDSNAAFGHFDRSGEVELLGSEQVHALASAVATAADIRPATIELEVAPEVDGIIAVALLSRLAERDPHVIVSHALAAPSDHDLRAAAGACAVKQLDRPVEPNTTYDQLRTGLFDAELGCDCAGANIDALARVTIDLGFPRYQVGWDAVRLRSYPPRFEQRGVATAEDVIARLATLSPVQRQDAVLP